MKLQNGQQRRCAFSEELLRQLGCISVMSWKPKSKMVH